MVTTVSRYHAFLSVVAVRTALLYDFVNHFAMLQVGKVAVKGLVCIIRVFLLDEWAARSRNRG